MCGHFHQKQKENRNAKHSFDLPKNDASLLFFWCAANEWWCSNNSRNRDNFWTRMIFHIKSFCVDCIPQVFCWRSTDEIKHPLRVNIVSMSINSFVFDGMNQREWKIWRCPVTRSLSTDYSSTTEKIFIHWVCETEIMNEKKNEERENNHNHLYSDKR